MLSEQNYALRLLRIAIFAYGRQNLGVSNTKTDKISKRPKSMPNVSNHFATVGKASNAPVGPTSGPKAGPTFAIAVQAAVIDVLKARPVSPNAIVSRPKDKINRVKNAMTEDMTSSLIFCPPSFGLTTAWGELIIFSCALMASASTNQRKILIEHPVDAVQPPMRPTMMMTTSGNGPQDSTSALP